MRVLERTAEGNVDQTVGAADASLDPDGDGREEDGDEAEEDVAAAHVADWRFGSITRLLLDCKSV